MFIASCSEPKISPPFKVSLRLFCQISQDLEFFSKEKTPIFIWGAKANFLALSKLILEFTACLKFWDLIIASFPKTQFTFEVIL